MVLLTPVPSKTLQFLLESVAAWGNVMAITCLSIILWLFLTATGKRACN
jgi:hypothetical protein